MIKSPNLQTFTFALAAGAAEQINAAGEFFRLADADGPVAVQIEALPETEFQPGQGYQVPAGMEFDRLTVRNPGAASVTMTIVIGTGRFDDFRFFATSILDTREQSPDTFATGAPVTAATGAATLLAAANTARAEIIVTNDGGGKIYIGGDAAAAAGEGTPLGTDATLVLTTTAAVYVRNDTGAAVSVAVAEVERS